MENYFLLVWGIILTLGGISEWIHPLPTTAAVGSHLLNAVMMAVGVLLIASFFVINKSFRMGRRMAVPALAVNIVYYIASIVCVWVVLSDRTFCVVVTVLVLGLIGLLSGYIYKLCNEIRRS